MATPIKSLRVPYGQAVHDSAEEKAVLKVLKEKRTMMGRETYEFEKNIAKEFGKKYGVMLNSGSSANYLAVEILDLPKGSEVITPILTFSTTLAPLVRAELIPVFIDVERGTYNIDVSQIESAISKKTSALMIPLLLGNMSNVKKIHKIARKHNLKVILDSCDTLGAKYDGIKTGEFGDIVTTSFYGSHIITAGGGGGMFITDNPKWRDRAKVLRGWGRGSALIGESEDPRLRYKNKIGNIPYDSKFIFSEQGYNYMPMELGSAFGNAQLKKINKFKIIREKNFKRLLKFFDKYTEFIILPLQNEKADTQWISFPITIKKSAPFTRLQLITYLEDNNIQTRPIFTGIVTMQPGFNRIKHRNLTKDFPVAKEVMRGGVLIGSHHGLEKNHLDKLEKTFMSFFASL